MAKTPEELLEKGFEEYIVEHLLKSGYIKGNPDDYNKEYAINTKILYEDPGSLFGNSKRRCCRLHKNRTKLLQ
ncbi:MAG: hypothetical protein HPY70_06875 [Firmicutes bacterium]|nr:hypothetical protein [Bacillota bacterium]